MLLLAAERASFGFHNIVTSLSSIYATGLFILHAPSQANTIIPTVDTHDTVLAVAAPVALALADRRADVEAREALKPSTSADTFKPYYTCLEEVFDEVLLLPVTDAATPVVPVLDAPTIAGPGPATEATEASGAPASEGVGLATTCGVGVAPWTLVEISSVRSDVKSVMRGVLTVSDAVGSPSSGSCGLTLEVEPGSLDNGSVGVGPGSPDNGSVGAGPSLAKDSVEELCMRKNTHDCTFPPVRCDGGTRFC